MPKLDGVRDKEGFGVGVDNLEAAVVVESGSDVETRASVEGTRESRGGFVVNDDRAARGTDGSGIKVEGAMEVFPGQDSRCYGSLAEKVEGEFCLGEKFVSEVVGEAVVDARQDSEEVCLEVLDGMFGCIGVVDVGRHELEGGILVLGNGAAVGLAGFIVKNVGLNNVLSSF